jgi:hypothetical protein
MPTDPSAEDLLDAGRPLPRWVRAVAIGVAVLLVGYLAVRLVAGGTSGSSRSAGAGTRPVTAPPLPRSPGGGPRMTRTVGCGPDLPPVQVPAAAGGRATHLRLLVGGRTLQRVDFDSGRATRLRTHPGLLPTEWFGSLARAGGTTYATVSSLPCEIVNTRVLAVHGNRTVLTSLAPSSQVVADGSNAWVVRDPPHVLAPLPGGHQIVLPAGFLPVAATGRRIVGYLVQAMDPEEIVTVDARTGQLGSPTGAFGAIVAAGQGRAYWIQRQHSDQLHSAAAGGGAERTYRLPTEPVEAPGAVSPDGRYLALIVRHAATDLRTGAHPRLDAQIAVLDLRTGRLRDVPGIALVPTYRPTLAFTSSGWLVIGYERGGREGLAAWRPGLSTAVRSPYRGATSPAAPPLAVTAG